MPALVLHAGPVAGQRIEIDRELVVGRADAEVTIADPEISRRHCSVAPSAGGIAVTDLGSTNGTWVNGARITAAVLVRPGDQLRLGDTLIAVELDAEAAAPPPPQPAPPAAPSPRQSVGQPLPAVTPSAPMSVFDPPEPARRRIHRAATRQMGGIVATYALLIAVAAALIVYFAAR